MIETKIVLSDKDIPKQWYNIMADMPNLPKPPLHPGTLKPIGPDDLSAIFPMALIEQEVSTQRWIDIPEEVLDIYIPCGDRLLFTGLTGLKRYSIHLQRSITNTKG
jgi:tryptophan synthase beta chain